MKSEQAIRSKLRKLQRELNNLDYGWYDVAKELEAEIKLLQWVLND